MEATAQTEVYLAELLAWAGFVVVFVLAMSVVRALAALVALVAFAMLAVKVAVVVKVQWVFEWVFVMAEIVKTC